jgi:hypothetical protein
MSYSIWMILGALFLVPILMVLIDADPELAKSWSRGLKDPLVWFTLALVIVGILQWRILVKTDETYQAQQRPWIQFNVVTDGPLAWAGNEVGMLAHLELKNTGSSPALNVRQVSRTLLIWDDASARQIQDQLCDALDNSERVFGATVFPNSSPPPLLAPFEILKEEIARFKATPPAFARPLVIGCISYVSSVDRSVHNTGYMLLMRPRPAQQAFELPKGSAPVTIDLVPWGASRVD